MADDGIGKAEQQIACLQLVSPVVDVQLDAPFYTDGDDETFQSDNIIIIRNSFQAVDYCKIIIYIVQCMLTVLKVFYIYWSDVLFFHILFFFSFCKVGE